MRPWVCWLHECHAGRLFAYFARYQPCDDENFVESCQEMELTEYCLAVMARHGHGGDAGQSSWMGWLRDERCV